MKKVRILKKLDISVKLFYFNNALTFPVKYSNFLKNYTSSKFTLVNYMFQSVKFKEDIRNI